jgi:hypothetical protein
LVDRRDLWDELFEEELIDSWAEGFGGGFDDDDEF